MSTCQELVTWSCFICNACCPHTPAARPASPSRIPALSSGSETPRIPTINEEDLALFLGSLPPSASALLVDSSEQNAGLYGPEGEEVDPEDPKTYDEAMGCTDAPKWVAAIKDELVSISDLKVWNLVPRSVALTEGRKILCGCFVFHLKRDQWGQVVRWKVSFVVIGCAAVPGVDFTKTTSPTM